MSGDNLQEVTQLLHAWRQGDGGALDRLMTLVYAELHRLAHIYMSRERPGRTLQTTAVVNEAYLQLLDAKKVDWKDRTHFFAMSSNLMRRILVEFARARRRHKRGDDARKVDFDEAMALSPKRGADLVPWTTL